MEFLPYIAAFLSLVLVYMGSARSYVEPPRGEGVLYKLDDSAWERPPQVTLDGVDQLFRQVLDEERVRTEKVRAVELEETRVAAKKERRRAFRSNMAFFFAGVMASIAVTLFVRPIF